MAACTPLYLPPVPDSMPAIEPTLLLSEVRVETSSAPGAAPTVTFVVDDLPGAGFVAVQWFPPTGGEVASASVWLDDESLGRTVRVPFPDDVARERDGRWRAVLSWDGRVVRQVDWTEPIR